MAKDFFFIPLGGSGGGGGDLSNYYTKSQVDTLIQDFITRSVNDLVNYYTKSETYTQAEVNTLIGSIESIHFEFAASTSDVQDPQSNVIYLIGPSGTGADQYEEYVYANNQWKKIGDTSIDLSNYATLTDLQNAINTAMATSQQYVLDNFYQKYEVDAMIAQVQTLQGIQGIKGTDGVDGVDGQQGIQGIKGTDGVNGVDGQQGVQGIKGVDGINGEQGIQGIQGAAGASIQGSQGIQGIQGASGGGGVETVELIELTSEELGELYEIVTTATPIGIDEYLAEHRLVAYGMPVISWGDGTFTIDDENNALIADDEGELGVAFYSDTKIEKGAETQDTITTYWYCIFKQEEGGNHTYVLEEGTNTYASRYDITTKSQSELADFYEHYRSVMASNNVYVGVYPVTSVIPGYTVQGYTALLLEYNISLALEADASTQTSVVKGDVGAFYILPNGMGDYYGARVTMPSKDYVDAVANTKQDTLTAGEGISIQGTTISATGGGGGGSAWYGTQAEFDALQNPSADVDYFISDQIKWDEIKGRPNIDSLATKSELNQEVIALDELVGKKENKIQYMSMQGFQSIQPQEGYVYAIEGSTVEMVFTFTDSTQATYNVVID